MIDWESLENHFLLNPRMPVEEQKHMMAIVDIASELKKHIWFATSGTNSSKSLKWVALSKEAFLNSAHIVNQHLESNSSDIWVNPLPEFHVGGLGISGRAYLSGAKEIDFKQGNSKWDPIRFHDVICKNKGTLSSLVSAQVFDLVTRGLQAPETLRAVIVGGGALPEILYQKATQLGWKLLPSYGLTECATQVATAPLGYVDFPPLIPLPHVQVKISEEDFVVIKSNSLLTGYGIFSDEKWAFVDPKKDGWYTTEDKGTFDNGILKITGRTEDFIKIGGESTNLQRLETILEKVKLDLKITDDLALVAIPESRLGHVIHLAVTTSNLNTVQPIIEKFQTHVLPFEQIRKIHIVNEIPRSPLKKLLKKKLLSLIV